MDIVNLLAPVFAIIITGWLFRILHIVPENLAQALILFSFYVAIPALLFSSIATQPISAIFNWGFIIASGVGALIIFLLVLFIYSFILQKDLSTSVIGALSSSMSNSAFVALPILATLFGKAGILPAAISLVFTSVIFTPIAVFLLEWAQNSSNRRPITLSAIIINTVLNPMVVSTLLALLYSICHFPLPTAINNYLNILGEALTPCALFAIGLGTNVSGIARDFKEAMILAISKIIILPIVVLLFAQLLHLSPLWTIGAVICSAVPTAKSIYILAVEYKTSIQLVGATIAASTLLSTLTLFAWLRILLHYWPNTPVN